MLLKRPSSMFSITTASHYGLEEITFYCSCDNCSYHLSISNLTSEVFLFQLSNFLFWKTFLIFGSSTKKIFHKMFYFIVKGSCNVWQSFQISGLIWMSTSTNPSPDSVPSLVLEDEEVRRMEDAGNYEIFLKFTKKSMIHHSFIQNWRTHEIKNRDVINNIDLALYQMSYDYVGLLVMMND